MWTTFYSCLKAATRDLFMPYV